MSFILYNIVIFFESKISIDGRGCKKNYSISLTQKITLKIILLKDQVDCAS
jgi:hypothetical protein